MGSTQDWNVVTFNARAPSSKAPDNLAAARRSGAVLTEQRTNVAVTANGVRVAHLDGATDAAKHATVSVDLRLAIMRARTAKGLTQKALATSLNVPVTVIAEYESGKIATPNNQFIAKLERLLGAKLPRVPKRA